MILLHLGLSDTPISNVTVPVHRDVCVTVSPPKILLVKVPVVVGVKRFKSRHDRI